MLQTFKTRQRVLMPYLPRMLLLLVTGAGSFPFSGGGFHFELRGVLFLRQNETNHDFT